MHKNHALNTLRKRKRELQERLSDMPVGGPDWLSYNASVTTLSYAINIVSQIDDD